MGMMALFRKKSSYNPYRRALLELIDTIEGEKLYISTGFIVSDVCEDSELIDTIEKASHKTLKSITFIAGKFKGHDKSCNCLDINPGMKAKTVADRDKLKKWPYCWSCHYNDFITRLNEKLTGNPITITSINTFEDSKYEWHAKVAIKVKEDYGIIKPCACIIGSSNLTKGAFGENHKFTSFVREADIYIWDERFLIKGTTPELIGYYKKYLNKYYQRAERIDDELVEDIDEIEDMIVIPSITLVPERSILNKLYKDIIVDR